MEPSLPIPSGLDSEPQKANHRRESKYQKCEFTGFHQAKPRSALARACNSTISDAWSCVSNRSSPR
jgi:hypothetical protein